MKRFKKSITDFTFKIKEPKHSEDVKIETFTNGESEKQILIMNEGFKKCELRIKLNKIAVDGQSCDLMTQ